MSSLLLLHATIQMLPTHPHSPGGITPMFATCTLVLNCLRGACCCGASCISLLPTAGIARLAAARELRATPADLQDNREAMLLSADC